MHQERGFILRAVRVVLVAMQRLGHDTSPLERRFGLDAASLDAPGGRWPMDRVLEFCDAALEASDDPVLGLHVAEASDASLWGIHGYAMLAAPDLRRAYEFSSWAHAMISDASRIELQVEGQQARLHYRMAESVPGHRLLDDVFLTINLGLGRVVAADPWVPSRCRFRCPAPTDVAEHRRIFGPHLAFGETTSGFDFPASMLERPNPRAAPGLFGVLERNAKDALAEIPDSASLPERVRGLILRRLGTGNPNADHVAERLGVSVRTLHRQLAAHETSHGEILDRVRHERALILLEQPQLSIQQIAGALGFTSHSSFTRAFKRWTSRTPQDHRSASRRARRPD